jgi:hypothetical protein
MQSNDIDNHLHRSWSFKILKAFSFCKFHSSFTCDYCPWWPVIRSVTSEVHLSERWWKKRRKKWENRTNRQIGKTSESGIKKQQYFVCNKHSLERRCLWRSATASFRQPGGHRLEAPLVSNIIYRPAKNYVVKWRRSPSVCKDKISHITKFTFSKYDVSASDWLNTDCPAVSNMYNSTATFVSGMLTCMNTAVRF